MFSYYSSHRGYFDGGQISYDPEMKGMSGFVKKGLGGGHDRYLVVSNSELIMGKLAELIGTTRVTGCCWLSPANESGGVEDVAKQDVRDVTLFMQKLARGGEDSALSVDENTALNEKLAMNLELADWYANGSRTVRAEGKHLVRAPMGKGGLDSGQEIWNFSGRTSPT